MEHWAAGQYTDKTVTTARHLSLHWRSANWSLLREAEGRLCQGNVKRLVVYKKALRVPMSLLRG